MNAGYEQTTMANMKPHYKPIHRTHIGIATWENRGDIKLTQTTKDRHFAYSRYRAVVCTKIFSLRLAPQYARTQEYAKY